MSMRGEWTKLMNHIYQTNGAIADIHMYFSSTGLIGKKTGVAIKKVWYGLGVLGDKAGSGMAHETGHTLGMSDSYMEGGNVRQYTNIEKYGTPGSYYSPYRTTLIKSDALKIAELTETLCTQHQMVDGRILGRVKVDQAFYHAANDTRDGICKKYVGENCEAKQSNSCTDMTCVCTNEYGDQITKEFKTMIRGLECGENKVCYDKVCASDEMMRWNRNYSVDSAECRYKYGKEIRDAEIFPNYKCIDNKENLCLFARKDWMTGGSS